MLGGSKFYSHDNQENYRAWADFNIISHFCLWLQLSEGCCREKEFHDAKKVGNGQEQSLQRNRQSQNQQNLYG
jgi:hypothetical protein